MVAQTDPTVLAPAVVPAMAYAGQMPSTVEQVEIEWSEEWFKREVGSWDEKVEKKGLKDFIRAMKAVWKFTWSVLKKGMYATIPVALEAASAVPIPVVAVVAKTLLYIWNTLQSVKNNRMKCVKLAQQWTESLAPLLDECVINVLEGPLVKLTKAFQEATQQLSKLSEKSFMQAAFSSSLDLAEIEECSKKMDNAFRDFDRAAQLRILQLQAPPLASESPRIPTIVFQHIFYLPLEPPPTYDSISPSPHSTIHSALDNSETSEKGDTRYFFDNEQAYAKPGGVAILACSSPQESSYIGSIELRRGVRVQKQNALMPKRGLKSDRDTSAKGNRPLACECDKPTPNALPITHRDRKLISSRVDIAQCKDIIGRNARHGDWAERLRLNESYLELENSVYEAMSRLSGC